MPVNVTALDLGSAPGVNGVTLNFTCTDPDLIFDSFVTGPLISGWLDGTTPSWPDSAWAYVNFSASDFTTTGLLGTLYVQSSVPDSYDITFVTGGGFGSEVTGGQLTFDLTVSGGTATVVPEPCSMLLMATGSIVFGSWIRRKQRKA